MGLRINSNVPSLVALRNLSLTDARQQKNLQRLSTGLKINRAADDPTGISLSESLKSQIGALKKVTENTQGGGNLVSVAESSLSKIGDLIHEIRASILFSLNKTSGDGQIAAEQDFIDNSIDAIRRIARTTRYAGIDLLNGNSGFQTTSVSSSILEVRPIRVKFNPILDPTPFSVQVTTAATAASITPGAVTGGSVTLRLYGPNGTATVQLASGTTALQSAAAIGGLREELGVFDAGGGVIRTEEVGTDARVRMEVAEGPGTIGGLTVGQDLSGQGTNAVATFGGASAAAKGNILYIDNAYYAGEVELVEGATGSFSFSIRNSGLLFQMGTATEEVDQERIGIPEMTPETLGKAAVTLGGKTIGGFLSTVVNGGANDLVTNPTNGARILDLALSDLNSARSALGAFMSNMLEPAGRSAAVAVENLSAAHSVLRDADYAEEAAELARNQILFESGVSVLAQAQRLPQSALRLLEQR